MSAGAPGTSGQPQTPAPAEGARPRQRRPEPAAHRRARRERQQARLLAQAVRAGARLLSHHSNPHRRTQEPSALEQQLRRTQELLVQFTDYATHLNGRLDLYRDELKELRSQLSTLLSGTPTARDLLQGYELPALRRDRGSTQSSR